MAKIYRDVEQGSAQWYRLRMGKPTASQMHKIVTPGGKLSEQRHAYKYRLIAERLLQESMDQIINTEWVERGREMEPAAAAHFEFQNDCELEKIGFVTDDQGVVGCSPDRLIKGVNESVEIKCPAPHTMIGYHLDGLGTDHRPQVQAQLLIGQFERCHFFGYHDKMPSLHLITLPDLGYLQIMRRLLIDFVEELERDTARARSLGAYVVSTNYTTPHEEVAPAPEPLTIIVP
jgi:hypothetical protein